MRLKKKKVLGIILSLVLVLSFMPGMSLTASAEDPYAGLKNNTTTVKFDGKEWYLIDYDDSTVTLLSKECVAASQYNSSGSYVEYASSTVKTAVDNWYSRNITDSAKEAVYDRKMFLLTKDQANAIYEANSEVLKCSKATGAEENLWWLCSPGGIDTTAACVFGAYGHVSDVSDGEDYGDNVEDMIGVRPALKLNLSKVTFDSNTKAFMIGTRVSYNVTFKVSNGSWNDESTADKSVTLTGNEGDTLKLSADQIPAVGTKPNDGYKAGSWDVAPSIDTAISSNVTYTYTYVADSSGGSSDSGNTSGGTSSGSSDNTNTNTDTSAKVPYDDVAISTGSVNDITGTTAATAESNPFETKIENNDNLTTLLSLTDAEVAQGVNVWLDIQDMSDTVPQAEKDIVQNASTNLNVGMYLDINLFKKVGGNTATKITETNGTVKASILIPESLWKAGRTFEIIRVHEGVPTVISGTYDENTHVFTFETDKFSTYALAYKDSASSSNSGTTSDSNSSNSSNNTQSTSPKTGDPNDIRVWYLLLLASFGGLGFLGLSMKKEN